MMMNDERFTDSERFIFKREMDGNMYLEDLEGHFEDVKLSDGLAEYLSSVLFEHMQMVNEKEKGIFELNNMADFIRSNNDLNVDVLIALINKRSWVND